MTRPIDRRQAIRLLGGGAAAAAALAIPTAAAAHAEDYWSLPFRWPAGWTSPVARNSNTILNAQYGALSLGCNNANRSHYWSYYEDDGRSEHLGLDLRAPAGTRIHAIADGRVLPTEPEMWGPEWGDAILVAHRTYDYQWFTACYGHIDVGNSGTTGRRWEPNDVVRRNELLGRAAAITAAPPHLHFGIRPGLNNPGGFFPATGNGNCSPDRQGTENPFSFLTANDPLQLVGNIVRWKRGPGDYVSWKVKWQAPPSFAAPNRYNPRYSRNYIHPNDFNCHISQGARNWGPMPARFLNQLWDWRDEWAAC